ncbi:TonB-dependent receptor [Occallatibacter savannae]|uniref:TonB-dependent receptor n=1 Tax=Occallatibacter savannae TaxID=1002691 RepID=UPI001EF64B4D|nr:TonB-dependent receptor [Occallatibacter savannae]
MGRDSSKLKMVRALRYAVLAIVCILVIQTKPMYGQVDEGAITGTVQDSSGAVVPNADVTLLNTDQGITLQTKSNASGIYTFSPVRAGHYAVTVTAQGFAKTTQKNLTLSVAQTLQVNISLKLGGTTETVEVNTTPPQLQTEEASVGQVVSGQEVNNLPLNGRNFTFLAQLGAGMQTPQADTRGNAASGAFSANGLRPAQNNYLLDGIDNNSNAVDFLNGTNFVILPPVDAIQEFKVQTADFSAELGRSAGAVMNATIKSGTNSLHGTVWEFLRNDKFDAADYFENNNKIKKGRLRLNQFGVSAGGPIIKNKMFFFGDYEGKRRVQGTSENANVPTAAMRSSNYTNLADILALNDGTTRPDLLGRAIQKGAVLDPATTRYVAAGAVDPVSGRTNTSGSAGYVRDPFSTKCGPSTASFTLAACSDLNQLPAGRIDPNAVKLLNLYPAPNSGLQTYAVSPNTYEHANTFDTREDFNPTEHNQIFFRFSYSDDPIYIPGIFGGIADGGSFQQGVQTAKSDQAVAGFTHVFSGSTVNQVRAGFNHLHTTRFGPEGTVNGLPDQYGIANIPQGQENGGLPAFSIGNLQTLGSNAFLPSDEVSQTLQVTDDFTKIYGKHSFKMGIEYQHVKFSTLQPAWSHGQFQYNGGFTDIPNASNTTGGIAQFVLPPTAAPATIAGNANPNGFSYSGGSDGVFASNINKTYDEKMYFASYFQDDFKVSPKLTVNLGLRWDYFGPINETNGGQANFVPSGPPDGKPEFIIPAKGKDNRTLSTNATCQGIGCKGFVDLLAQDGIALNSTDKYGQGLLQTQKHNFAPRVGAAWEVSPKLVVRGGFGLFYNSFENQGYGPNIGENYPFVFNLSYFPQSNPADPSQSSQVAPIKYNSPYANCPTSGPGGTASFESGFSCIPLTPAALNALGLGLQGLQFDYATPRTYSANLTFQYSFTNTLAATASYVTTKGSDLQGGVGYQNVTQILPSGLDTKNCGAFAKFQGGSCVPFKDFGGGSYQATYGESRYHGLQTKLEKQYANGLTFLLTYTWSKTMSDAGDLLNGGTTGGLRAYAIPGLGPKFDYALANFDIRHVVHFSGGYELPFGKGKQYMNHGGPADLILGGWAMNWIVTLQGGQPLNFGCPSGTVAGAGCNTVLVKGQDPKLGIKTKTIDGAPRPFWVNNPAAFSQPCQLTWDGTNPGSLAPKPDSPKGCIPLNGAGALGSKPGQIAGPGFHRLDYSLFKNFKISERFSTQFRAEFFNILNHPNFNAPNFGGNGVVAIGGSGNYTDPHFGEVGSTRDEPFDPRQIQFALKLYY